MDQQELVVAWLNDAHAMENALIKVLEHRVKDAEDFPMIQSKDKEHLEQTRRHAELVNGCIERLGASPSTAKSVLGTLFGAMQAPMTGMYRDEVVKNLLTDHAAERFEVASYRALIAAARQAGDPETASTCELILREDEAMADWLIEQIPVIVQEQMRELSSSPR